MHKQSGSADLAESVFKKHLKTDSSPIHITSQPSGENINFALGTSLQTVDRKAENALGLLTVMF
jgi:hypothetical protein